MALSAEDLGVNLHANHSFGSVKGKKLDAKLEILKRDVFELLNNTTLSSKNDDSFGGSKHSSINQNSTIINANHRRTPKAKSGQNTVATYNSWINDDKEELSHRYNNSIFDEYNYGFDSMETSVRLENVDCVYSRLPGSSSGKLRRMEKEMRKEKFIKYKHENIIRTLKRQNELLKTEVKHLKSLKRENDKLKNTVHYLKESFKQSERVRKALKNEIMFLKRRNG